MYPFPLVQMLVLSVIVLVLTFIVVIFIIRPSFHAYDIHKQGIPVLATVTDIHAEFLPFAHGGSKTSFFIHAEWQDPKTGKVYHFKSKAGGAHLPLKHPPGSTIEVLVDPRNPRRYEVQLQFEERRPI